jgi:hypothetical protein
MARRAEPGYHSLHFEVGFMGDPAGHLNASAKAGVCETGPLTLHLDGEWTSRLASAIVAASVARVHQV